MSKYLSIAQFLVAEAFSVTLLGYSLTLLEARGMA
jgi:hypothetical protein